MTRIHPSAVVDSRAELAEDVQVGPGAVIGPEVRVGRGCVIGAYAVLDGPIQMGQDNQVFSHAVLGGAPQDLKYQGQPTRLEMGDRNLVREFVTVHRGTPQGSQVTRIGSDVFLMAYSHVGHDNVLEDHAIVANGVQLGGHVRLGQHAIVGGCSAVHQFVRIGESAFIGGGSIVEMDVLPYCKATGNRARLHGLNVIGLGRRGFTEADIRTIKAAYRAILHQNLLATEAIDFIDRQLLPACPAVGALSAFLKTSSRGITR